MGDAKLDAHWGPINIRCHCTKYRRSSDLVDARHISPRSRIYKNGVNFLTSWANINFCMHGGIRWSSGQEQYWQCHLTVSVARLRQVCLDRWPSWYGKKCLQVKIFGPVLLEGIDTTKEWDRKRTWENNVTERDRKGPQLALRLRRGP